MIETRNRIAGIWEQSFAQMAGTAVLSSVDTAQATAVPTQYQARPGRRAIVATGLASLRGPAARRPGQNSRSPSPASLRDQALRVI